MQLFPSISVLTTWNDMLVPSDEELVARHLQGDRYAFTALVERYAERLFNLAYRFTSDRADAEDIAQECFLHAYDALPRSRTDQPFKPWLFQIAVNLCRDRARKKRPQTFSELEDEHSGVLEAGDGPSTEDLLPDEALQPLEQLEEKEIEDALRAAVMELPEEDRTLLTLRYNEELSYEEIGRLLNLLPQTVGARLFRAKRRLRGTLSKFEEVDA
jgi:RNA polymerase sigma-70 factor (ECF subfamily)